MVLGKSAGPGGGVRVTDNQQIICVTWLRNLKNRTPLAAVEISPRVSKTSVASIKPFDLRDLDPIAHWGSSILMADSSQLGIGTPDPLRIPPP